MSISLMSMAWKLDIQTAQKMALLAMCDWANDDGGSLHPSISALAQRISCSPRQAQRILHSLIADGWLTVVGNPFGGAPGATRHYRIDVKKLSTGDANVTPNPDQTGDAHVTGDKLSRVTSATETGDTHVVGRVTSATETGDTHVTQPTIEPPINHHRTTKGKKVVEAVCLPDWLPSGAFADFVEFRKSIKKPMTPKAQELAVQELEKLKDAGHNPVDVINQSILSGWQGLFAVKPTRPQPAARATGKHSGFGRLDYNQGINDDGSFD